jgi:hypothetical protein
MIIKDVALKNIKPYKHNNRIHSDQQIQRIADSIKKFGFNQPIVIDENNEILVGHGRLLAAEKLGLKDAPCIQLKDLSSNEKRAYRILDNKLQNDSTWDFESLQLEMQELKENDFDMSFCGLDELGKLFPEPEPEVSEDELTDLTLDSRYAIEITCINELEQKEVFEKLKEEGYKCRILTL